MASVETGSVTKLGRPSLWSTGVWGTVDRVLSWCQRASELPLIPWWSALMPFSITRKLTADFQRQLHQKVLLAPSLLKHQGGSGIVCRSPTIQSKSALRRQRSPALTEKFSPRRPQRAAMMPLEQVPMASSPFIPLASPVPNRQIPSFALARQTTFPSLWSC
jgi:hypothetical protein